MKPIDIRIPLFLIKLLAPELHLSVWQHVVLLPVDSVPVLVVAHAAKQPLEYVDTPKTVACIV